MKMKMHQIHESKCHAFFGGESAGQVGQLGQLGQLGVAGPWLLVFYSNRDSGLVVPYLVSNTRCSVPLVSINPNTEDGRGREGQ
jgi:hypothetical protein